MIGGTKKLRNKISSNKELTEVKRMQKGDGE